MKRIFFFIALSLMFTTLMAQNHAHQQRFETFSLTLKAAHGEVFTVYVDGDIVNHTPQQQVHIKDLDQNPHDVYVVLTRPKDKITMMVYQPSRHREECIVRYDHRRGMIELEMPNQQPLSGIAEPLPPAYPSHQPQHCSNEEVALMVQMIHNESFDSTKEKLALEFAQKHSLLASQIMQLAQEFSFDNHKKYFLKKAYSYCVDPENYAVVIGCLTFSSDKNEILDFISHH